MITLIKVIYESIRQAFQSLAGNKLRTFLSLLGITIGIFCIIAVKSAVDSLQDNIISGFNELGTDVIYVDKIPWDEDPGQNFWKYTRRPDPDFYDYQKIKKRSKLAKTVSYAVFTGGRTIKFESSSVKNAFIMGSTPEYRILGQLHPEYSPETLEDLRQELVASLPPLNNDTVPSLISNIATLIWPFIEWPVIDSSSWWFG